CAPAAATKAARSGSDPDFDTAFTSADAPWRVLVTNPSSMFYDFFLAPAFTTFLVVFGGAFLTVFLAVVFLAVVFLAVVFLAAVFLVVVFFAGAPPSAASLARRSESNSLARASVRDSGTSPLRSDAL